MCLKKVVMGDHALISSKMGQLFQAYGVNTETSYRS